MSTLEGCDTYDILSGIKPINYGVRIPAGAELGTIEVRMINHAIKIRSPDDGWDVKAQQLLIDGCYEIMRLKK